MSVDADLIRAIRHLGARSYMTVIWTNPDLVVCGRHGEMAPEISVGCRLCEAALPLVGLEEQIWALRTQPGGSIEVPNIDVVTGLEPAATSPSRLSYIVTWDEASGRYVCLLQRAISANDLTVELQRQVRRRTLMETQLVEQAKAIEAANLALQQANRDLGDFARIVSHDLKSPMRALRYFAEDLERALAAPSDEDAPAAHLNRLKGQSARMSAMLTGLLAYARLEDKAAAVAEVDLQTLVRGIIASLPRPPGFSILLEGDWPVVETLEAPLDLVLRNLIDNAIKHHDGDGGTLVLRCSHAAGGVRIDVEDDGPGIAASMHDAVFKPYTRLSAGSEEAGGTGMGLTLVKRAVDVAGGRLELASDPEERRGACFKLLWPVVKMA